MALRRLTAWFAVVAAVWLLAAPPAHAGLVSGIGRIVAGVFQLPLSTLVGTLSGPPVLGTVFGAVNGAIGTVTMVTGGVFEVAAAAIPWARAAAPFVLPFLF